jgi:hypothetical protein
MSGLLTALDLQPQLQGVSVAPCRERVHSPERGRVRTRCYDSARTDNIWRLHCQFSVTDFMLAPYCAQTAAQLTCRSADPPRHPPACRMDRLREWAQRRRIPQMQSDRNGWFVLSPNATLQYSYSWVETAHFVATLSALLQSSCPMFSTTKRLCQPHASRLRAFFKILT